MTALVSIQVLAVKGDHCFVTALFICDHLNIKAPQKFIVDTGTIHTTLPESRARELGVNLEKLETYKVKIKMAGIGGGADARMLGGIRLIFTATDGSPIEEKLPFIHVLWNPVPRNEEDRKILSTIPALLGLDILRRFTLTFKERNFAYLESAA
jgi:hypothetical protein